MDGFLAYIVGWSLPALVCLLVGLGLMIFEMFTPGMGLPGILGAGALIAAVVLRADTLASALSSLSQNSLFSGAMENAVSAEASI